MFRQIDSNFLASPQITVEEVGEAAQLGVKLIINNRPEGEDPTQTPGEVIEAAAKGHGIDYVAIPVTHAGFSQPQVVAMAEALEKAGDNKVLAYCRSGTRSTLLWSLAEASKGRDPEELSECAAGGGYDLSPVRSLLDMLASVRE